MQMALERGRVLVKCLGEKERGRMRAAHCVSLAARQRERRGVGEE